MNPQNKTGKYPDIKIGSQFGKLLVIAIAEPDARGQRHWLCRCECGNEKRIMANNLKRGLITACGCERNKRIGALRRTHGLSHLPEHEHWCNMIGRCYGQAETKYKANGTYVCQRWRESFPAFLEDMGSKPTAGHSVDRIDNSGSYTCGKCDECKKHGSPLNCRWATFTEQMRNTSRSHVVTHEGEARTIAEWCEVSGIPYSVLYGRLVYGWDFGLALTTPP